MGAGWTRIATAAAIAAAMLGLGAVTARADDSSAWLKERRMRFAAYRAEHPSSEAEIAGIQPPDHHDDRRLRATTG